MIVEKKSFGGGINSNISERLIGPDEVLNLMNGRWGVSKYGRSERVENTPGTTQIVENVSPPYGIHETIGSIFDEQFNRMIYFKDNTHDDHGIYAYDITTGITYAVIYDTQVTGGLNFSQNSLIHSAKISNGILYWPDGTNNQPRSLHIDAAIKANLSSYDTDAVPYQFPLNFSELTLIKPPPIMSPNIAKATDVAFVNNFIYADSFQFAFMYEFENIMGETVIGAYSKSSRLNKPEDDYNYIQVKMDPLEFIPPSVRFVYLVVRSSINNVDSAKIIKTWDRQITDEANEIAQQNAVTAQLTYDFYNNVTGRTIAPYLILKQADAVPYYAQTAELARNRLLLGNVVSGDPTPTTTSLAFSLLTTNLTPSTYLTNLIELRHRNGRSGDINYAYSAWYVQLPSGVAGTAGWYELTSTAQTTSPSSLPYPTLPPAPPVFAFAGLTFRGTSLSQVGFATAPVGTTRMDGPFITSTANIVTITGITVNVFDVFKNGGQRKLGVQFYDFAMRPIGGVVTNDDLIATIPRRSFTYGTGVTALVWTLDNTNALVEIPDNAYYYAVVCTKEILTRFFIESFTDGAKYATKNNEGVFEFNNTSFITGAVGIGLDATALIKSGLGYTQQNNDVAYLVDDSNNRYTLPVITSEGNFIVVKAEDIGNLQGKRIIYEIYKPYQTSDQEPFWIMGEIYRVTDPETSSRGYEILSDSLNPDCYAITRSFNSTTYLAEGMSPNDLYYQRWDTDAGKLSLVTKLGRETKIDEGVFSNVYIPGTQNNGLNSFEAANFFNTPQEAGGITKFFLTDKIQDQGSVMLAICRSSISSVYLGETQVSDSSGATKFFAQSTGVIGTINNLQVSYGSVHPESVVGYKGLVFGIDVPNGVVWQYANNGLVAVSDYNQTRFFKRYCQDYLAASINNLDNINGFHHIRFTVDPFHKELLVSLPGLIYENYANTLPSYSSVPSYATSIINRFDLYDQLQKVMCFRFEENKWGSNFQYGAEWFDYAGDVLYGWKDGRMYIHDSNTTNWNRFYGVDQPIRICTQANMNASALKDLFNIAIESSVIPDYVVAMTNIPNTQITDLSSADDVWEDQQGVFYATFYGDRLSPNSTGTPDERMRDGDLLTDFTIFVMCEMQAYTQLEFFQYINIGFEVAKGQQQIITKL
jgi:hypothetical protein